MEMKEFYSTREVAKILGIRPDSLSRIVWLGQFTPPPKRPSGNFLWTKQDIERASWALLHRAYQTEQEGRNDE